MLKKLMNWLETAIIYCEAKALQLELQSKEPRMARIIPLDSRFAIVLDGNVVASYSRQRDARRSAIRRGLTVA